MPVKKTPYKIRTIPYATASEFSNANLKKAIGLVQFMIFPWSIFDL